MLERLSRGPLSVSELAAPFEVSLAAVLQHLQVLEESGLIRTEKTGRVRTCSLEPKGLRLANQWLNERVALWEHKLDRLGSLLEETDEEAAAKPPNKGKTR